MEEQRLNAGIRLSHEIQESCVKVFDAFEYVDAVAIIHTTLVTVVKTFEARIGLDPLLIERVNRTVAKEIQENRH